ncbi:DUF6896 domain-containing protein [Stieleria neptunia]|uniref:DUF6896 domain-containing protein n=1 Tax=Stieleria neptunia TaxID=2527979 RepID=UPI0036F24FC1
MIANWITHRDAAAALLVAELNLESPRDVLRPENRGRHDLDGTGWSYRTHGIGVDVTRSNGHGGIDFDFSTLPGQLFAPPDFWRLVLFAKRSVHDRTIDTTKFTPIIDDADSCRDVIERVLGQLFPTQQE